MKIKINDKIYNVKVATTILEKRTGLRPYKEFLDFDGMLFDYSDNPLDVIFTMNGVELALDIIFINEDLNVISVEENCKDDAAESNVAYVVELAAYSGVKKDDELEILEEKQPIMKVLYPDGSEQYKLYGGERIFSRKNTQIIIKKAKKADLSKSENDYKSLGKYMFKCIKTLDNNTPQYVEKPL